MAAPFHHAVSSQRKWGGEVSEYLPIHDWFDESKAHLGDFRHRALRHHALGVRMCEERFGTSLVLTSGREIPVRWVAEQHLIEDFGFIPTVQDWLSQLRPEPWMTRARKLSADLEATKS